MPAEARLLALEILQAKRTAALRRALSSHMVPEYLNGAIEVAQVRLTRQQSTFRKRVCVLFGFRSGHSPR